MDFKIDTIMTTTEKLELRDLLIKLRDHIETESGFVGMCGSLMEMNHYAGSITSDKRDYVQNYINKSRGKHYYKPSPLYWWKPGNKEPRINWLNREIIKLTLDF